MGPSLQGGFGCTLAARANGPPSYAPSTPPAPRPPRAAPRRRSRRHAPRLRAQPAVQAAPRPAQPPRFTACWSQRSLSPAARSSPSHCQKRWSSPPAGAQPWRAAAAGRWAGAGRAWGLAGRRAPAAAPHSASQPWRGVARVQLPTLTQGRSCLHFPPAFSARARLVPAPAPSSRWRSAWQSSRKRPRRDSGRRRGAVARGWPLQRWRAPCPRAQAGGSRTSRRSQTPRSVAHGLWECLFGWQVLPGACWQQAAALMHSRGDAQTEGHLQRLCTIPCLTPPLPL
jgi:hypothetical protein